MINAAHWDASRRFGLFLHWGVYALSEFHEQYQFVMQIPREEYEQFPKRFNPTRFDAREIVSLAKSVGMRYLCVTSKHHDGFCMWDTDETDYKVTNTPFGRDVVGELAAACAEQDMAFCLYYSIPDWHHPNAYNPKSSHQIAPRPTDEPDMSRYIAYIKRQITELLTRYGAVLGHPAADLRSERQRAGAGAPAGNHDQRPRFQRRRLFDAGAHGSRRQAL